MGSKGSSPDYKGAAEQTAAGDLRNLQYQTNANRPDTITPWGNSTWTLDALGNAVNRINMSPSEQRKLDAQNRIEQERSNVAEGMMGSLREEMSTPEGFWSGIGGYQNAPNVPTYDRSGYDEYANVDTKEAFNNGKFYMQAKKLVKHLH
jgi:hypothetical protein